MKNFFAILIATVICLAALPQAKAQYQSGYALTTLISGGTNNIAAGSGGVAATNQYTNLVMVANRSEYLVFGAKYNFHAAPVGGTPSLTFRIQRSIDGSNWESQYGGSTFGATGFHVFTANGATNACVAITNLTVAGMPYFRIVAVENTNSAVVTNLTVWYGVKR